MMRSIERMLRKGNFTPGSLSYNPVFKLFVNSFDILPRLFFKKHFTSLPPAHLRCRVGVGYQILNNHVTHLHGVRLYWLYALSKGYINMGSNILDIGCGCGRYAQYLRDYQHYDDRFHGNYIGIDIDEEMLDWCRKNFDERFTFYLSADRYRKVTDRYTPYELPVSSSTIDLVFSMSLYTHLLSEELVNYTKESYRVLKPGGHVNATFFSLDHPPPTYGGRHTFRHKIGDAHVELIEHPEAAVAYHEKFISDVFRDAGLKNVEFEYGPGRAWQILAIAQKG
jgi:SAM-dependent methyltransferase